MPDEQPQSTPPKQAPMPDGLRTQLEQFKTQLWKIKVAEAILAGFFGLLLSYLLVFGLDRFMETPNSLRLLILVLGVSLFSLFAPYWIRRWVFGHRQENQLARLISRRFPKLGDRLLGVVELQNQQETKETLSPELRSAAMRTVAAETAKRDLLDALPAARHRKGGLVVMALLALSATAMISVPDAGINSLKRWLMPLSNTERYTFTQLDLSNISQPHHVPYGESFSITIPLSENTNRHPDSARAQYGNGEWIEAPLVNRSYTFTFPGQRAKDHIHLEADDARHSLPVEPVIRPEMEQVQAMIELPAYLQRDKVSADLRAGYLSVLEGSQVTIQTTINRAISAAGAKVIHLPKEAPEALPLPESAEAAESATTAETEDPSASPDAHPEQKMVLTINERKLTTPAITMPDHALLIPVEWTDIYNLKPDTSLKIRLENTQDQSPSTYIQGVERQHIMLVEETLSFEVLAEDDYGLKACGLSWEGEFTKPTSQQAAKGELTLAQGAPTKTTLNQSFSFSPINMGIEPQKLILRSWTEDYKPDRKRVYSEPIVLYILTRDEHAQVLKNEFDRAIGELEDIARKEQNLNDENQRIERNDAEKLQDETNLKKIQSQQDAERENKERMQRLTEKMEKLFKDAVRNGEIDKEALQKMGKALQNMRELGAQDLPKVEQKLQDAQSQRNTAEKTKKDLQEAIEEQKKALAKMKQALKDANEANRNFEASTFVNRLKRAATEEDGIASTFIDSIDDLIGATFEELDPVQQRAVKEAHNQQRQTASDVRWIQEDLAHYYARTQKEEHKTLVEEMRSSRIDEAMEFLSNQVASNISVKSLIEAKRQAEQLRKWAKQLEGDQGGGGGGGQGGGQPSQEDKDFEFMLKVMRMIQKEQDIRERTRALEDLKRSLKLETPTN
ncbi:hypothetical protein HW115_10560 [Verrucomicrobiaceae bacterium N1E253]|uniref:Uncharacterized protein n=1 Tax=Oceaniferula marina TaxID=2748318 RepID=A0A851GPI3_9BACT|nr:hypothetical protein [Oceaniferula marina]NWK56054.1 hypothetical protein [Oceaniferula marina]